jgi:hypothetical protein
MTRYAPLWQQAGNYAASVDRALINALWPVGGAVGAVPTVVSNQMQMNIPPGFCAVPLGANGTALCRWDATELVNFLAAPGANSRIDLVVCTVRDNAIDAGANNDFIFQVVAGTVAASPVAPAVPANSFAMMQVTIGTGIANLNSAPVTDLRSPMGPMGRVISATGPASQTDFGVTAATVMSVSARVKSGRRYRVSAYARGFQANAATGLGVINFVTETSAQLMMMTMPGLTQNLWMAGTANHEYNNTGNDGFVTFAIQANITAGALRVLANSCRIIVEDIGPS